MVIDNQQWLDDFRRRVARERVPLTAMLELTSRCNLRCVHCYLGSQEEQHRKRALELSTDRVKALIDELVEAGCLYLTITGGDPMMRKDFAEVYRHARERGLLVTVFCDAILVTDSIIKLFEVYPPRKVEVSIYGATAQTYETVTRVPGSFPKAMHGIQRLLDAGVNVLLKTVLMSINKHELSAMETLAKEREVPFRFDGAIFPCLPNREQDPLALRVDPREVIEAEMADPVRRQKWVESYEQAQRQPESPYLYTCGAGASSVYLDPFGHASPCLMTTQYRYSLEEKSFIEVWDEDIVEIRELRNPQSGVLGQLRGACAHCPGCNYLETGREEAESSYTRELRSLRFEAIKAAKEVTTHGSE